MSSARVALDTNVVVRFLMADDPAQARRAKALIAKHPVYVAPTVLLETEWVLRSGYEQSSVQIARYLRAFLGLPQVKLGEAEAVSEALHGYEAGLDFADALHLALSAEAAEFATFDQRLIKKGALVQQRRIRAP
jgi:predicted nucleic-acid-binding protein